MSTSKLQRQTSILLGTHLGQHTIRENHRPEWLEGLELDFYIEELDVAIEVQGQQHFEYTPYFHKSYADFCEQRDRDERKNFLCMRNGVRLYYIERPGEILQLVEQLLDTELPVSIHQNYLAFYERVMASPQNPKPSPPIPTTSKHSRTKGRNIKRWTRKLEAALLKRKSAVGEVTIENLSRAVRKRIDQLARAVGQSEARRIAEEIEQNLPSAPPRSKKKASVSSTRRHRKRQKARKRTAKAFGDSLYLVSGGSRQHVVWFESFDNAVCDCSGWETAKENACCHIYAVEMFEYPQDEPKTRSGG